MKKIFPRTPRVFQGLFLLFFLGTLVLPMMAPAQAAIVPCGRNEGTPAERAPCTTCHLIVGIHNIVTWIRNVMVVFAITAIVAMGILYIVSTGNQSLMEMAKGGITAALIGFAVIIGAWLIVNIIFTLPIFSSTTGLIKPNWYSFTCDTTSASRAPIACSDRLQPNDPPITGVCSVSGNCPAAKRGGNGGCPGELICCHN